jgi:hypothetical protein
MIFYPYFPHLLSEMVKFQYKWSADYFVWCFVCLAKTGKRKGRTFLEAVNQITFTRVP